MPENHTLSPPAFGALPTPVYFRYDEFQANTHFAAHRHDWAQLNYASHGLMHLWVNGEVLLSPPGYAVWIPPGELHGCYNADRVVYRSVYVDTTRHANLPAHTCTLAISGILRAILLDFARRDIDAPSSPADQRLAQVAIDQLAAAPLQPTHYLPYSEHVALKRILDDLRQQPESHRTQAQWARSVHLTERTLARLCRRELGIPLGEWHQRLRFLLALDALEGTSTIQQIAYDLGYGNASTFISAFRKRAGTTPERYRLTQH